MQNFLKYYNDGCFAVRYCAQQNSELYGLEYIDSFFFDMIIVFDRDLNVRSCS